MVLRAATTLKLCHFEETGAFVRALTMSIPENPDNRETEDCRSGYIYRYVYLYPCIYY